MENCSVKKLKNSINIEGLEKLGEYYEYSVPVVSNVLYGFSVPAKLGAGDSIGVLVEGDTLGSNVGSQNVRGITSTGQPSSSLLGQYKVGKMKECSITESYKGIYVGIPADLISISGTANITVKIPFNSMPNMTLISDISSSLVDGKMKSINVGNIDAGLYYIKCSYDNSVSLIKANPIDVNIGSTFYNVLNPYSFLNFSQDFTNVGFFLGASRFSGSGNIRFEIYKLDYE